MSSSLIDDARKVAQEENDFEIRQFHLATDEERRKINLFLQEAVKQGFYLELPGVENSNVPKGENTGNFREWKMYPNWVDYAIVWIIQEPGGSKCKIVLGANVKSSGAMTPSITAEEAEVEFKDWLKVIYKSKLKKY
jgi:hypothetical protein